MNPVNSSTVALRYLIINVSLKKKKGVIIGGAQELLIFFKLATDHLDNSRLMELLSPLWKIVQSPKMTSKLCADLVDAASELISSRLS